MPLWKKQLQKQPDFSRPILFLDRDGVLIKEENYLSDPDGVLLLPGVTEALVRAREAGFLLVGITNQSGLGRGYFQMSDFQVVMTRLQEKLAMADASLDAWFYCPHAPDAGCLCRKPNPGMIQEARQALGREKAGSWVIGDKGCDVALGRNLGLGGILVRTGHGAQEEANVVAAWGKDPEFAVVDDLSGAVDYILQFSAAKEDS